MRKARTDRKLAITVNILFGSRNAGRIIIKYRLCHAVEFSRRAIDRYKCSQLNDNVWQIWYIKKNTKFIIFRITLVFRRNHEGTATRSSFENLHLFFLNKEKLVFWVTRYFSTNTIPKWEVIFSTLFRTVEVRRFSVFLFFFLFVRGMRDRK